MTTLGKLFTPGNISCGPHVKKMPHKTGMPNKQVEWQLGDSRCTATQLLQTNISTNYDSILDIGSSQVHLPSVL